MRSFDLTHIDKAVFWRVLGAFVIVISLLLVQGCGKSYSRDDFTKLVMNKTEAEVKNSLGEPDWINESTPVMWIYRRATFVSAGANQRDAQAVITFGPGDANTRKVVEVRFD